MPSAAEITSKLAEATQGEADSDTATTEEAIQQAVKEAAAPESKEEATSDTKSEEGTKEKSEEDRKTSDHVPYERFKTKVDQVNELEGKLNEFTEREKQLEAQVSRLETEHDVLERVRNLADNPKYRPMVETLDKAIRGIEEEVDSGEKTEKEAETDTKKLFDDHKAELEEAFADQRADLLLQQSSSYAERLMDALPDTYNEQDKAAISQLWTPEVNWDSIEDDPSTMKSELLDSLTKVLKKYKTPRGELEQKVKELETKTQSIPEIKDPEDELKGILDKEWGKVNTAEDGKASPDLSDDEFTRALARVMRGTQ
jgi:cell division protein FtsB